MNQAKEPTANQLRQLYSAAAAFRRAEPWQTFYDSDLIGVENPIDKTIGYCSVMGKSGQHFALGVFLGEAGLFGFAELMGRGEISDSQVMYHLNHLMCSFEDRGLLDKKDHEVIKGLGLTFRGKKGWPLFRHYEEGFLPWYLSAEHCSFLTMALQQTLQVTEDYRRGRLKLDFEQGTTVLRRCKEDNGILRWVSEEFKVRIPLLSYSPLQFRNELFLQRLKKVHRNTAFVLQAETCYLPLTVQEETDEKPYFPRAFFLADGASGMILDYSMYRRAKDDVEQVLNGLQDLFLEKGIPRQIQVRPGKMAAILEDFCEKADVDLKVVPDLPLIEEFIRGIAGQL